MAAAVLVMPGPTAQLPTLLRSASRDTSAEHAARKRDLPQAEGPRANPAASEVILRSARRFLQWLIGASGYARRLAATKAELAEVRAQSAALQVALETAETTAEQTAIEWAAKCGALEADKETYRWRLLSAENSSVFRKEEVAKMFVKKCYADMLLKKLQDSQSKCATLEADVDAYRWRLLAAENYSIFREQQWSEFCEESRQAWHKEVEDARTKCASLEAS